MFDHPQLQDTQISGQISGYPVTWTYKLNHHGHRHALANNYLTLGGKFSELVYSLLHLHFHN